MRKLISIGVVLALLVTFMVPVVVGAQDDCCEYTAPTGPDLPDKTTKTLAGAGVWTGLATMDIMGRAVCQTTGVLAGNLGGWSDELGIMATEVAQVGLAGVADILEFVMEEFLGMAALGEAVGDLLRGFAGVFNDAE